MPKQLINLKGLKVLEVDFNGDTLLAVKLKENGKIYIGVKSVYSGIGLSEGQYQSQTRKIHLDLVLSKGIADLQLPTKGGNQKALCIELDFLPLMLAKISITPDMIENKSEVVDKLIEYQLKAKDILAKAFLHNEKEWDVHREACKMDRKRETSMIDKYIPESKTNKFIYSKYTDLVYIVLFGKKAKEIRADRELTKQSEQTRDYFTVEELKLIDEAESIVTGLVALGFKYDYIAYQLQQKYIKQLS